MTRYINNEERGIAVLLYVTIVAVITVLLMVVAQSRFLLALKRQQSSADSLVSSYQAESVANDYIARLMEGYIGEEEFPFTENIDLGKTNMSVTGTMDNNVQIINVVANLGFAVSRIEAKREIVSLGKYNNVDIIISLDCTGSMNAGATCPDCYDSPTRIEAQKDAAINFVDNLSLLEDADKFKLGVMVFGIDSKWLSLDGKDVSPKASISFSDIKDALDKGFDTTRENSPACQSVMDSTSVGTPYKMSHDYFADNESGTTKQIEIVITDGIPNSRIPDSSCTPNVFCPAFPLSKEGVNYCYDNNYGWSCYQADSYIDGPYDADNFNQAAYDTCEPLGKQYLRCVLADTNTYVPELGKEGIRNPDVDAYAVTIFSNPPSDVLNIFRRYATRDGYFNASQADQLSSVLDQVLSNIISDRSEITIKRQIPQ